jgi:hypothetical protein
MCREIIGKFYPEDIAEPITGAMFHSKDPRHGFPPPFQSPGLYWENMRCPYCRLRPFLAKQLIFTTEGYWSTETKEHVDKPIVDDIAGRIELEHTIAGRSIRDDIADRIESSDLDKRMAPVPREASQEIAKAATDAIVEELDKPPPTEKIPMHYGPDAPKEVGEQEPAETVDVTEMTPEERKQEAERRIALDEEQDGGKVPFPFPCPIEGCDKGYKHKSSLYKHADKHHNQILDDVAGG